MKHLSRKLALALAVAAALPGVALAESDINTGTGTPLTASARVDFRITIPKMVYLRVGTGVNLADAQTATDINLIDFNVPAANLGDATAISATAGSGDVGNGTVTARLIGNNGTITLTANATGALSNGAAGDTISYSQISTATAAIPASTAGLLTAPALSDATSTSSVAPNIGTKVVNRDARWTYTYLNSAVVAPGTYGGVNTQNGRVTYTASMP
jgi:hypothetical protein